MSLQYLPVRYFVPQGRIPNASPQTIKFSPDGRGVSIVALKNMSAQAVPNASAPAGVPGSLMTLRVIWPGYHPDVHGPRSITVSSQLTRGGLAIEVAKQAVAFLDFIKKQRIASSDPAFAIMEKNIAMGHVFLEGIVNTSENCWQLIFCVVA